MSEPATSPTAQELDRNEPLLQVDVKRLLPLPITHPDIWKMYKQAEASFWTAEEIDMSKDPHDWENKLNDDERYFISHVLAFFAGSDGIVNENLITRFSREIQNFEARSFYGFQQMMENVHCVAPETLVLTSMGYFPIVDLEDEPVLAWNGERFTKVVPKLTSDSAELVRVNLNNGMTLRCTREHKWLVVSAGAAEPAFVYAKNLKPGDAIAPYKLPLVNDVNAACVVMVAPILQGLYAGLGANEDGTVGVARVKYATLDLPELPEKYDTRTGMAYYNVECLEERFFVPLQEPFPARIGWLAGLLAAVGEESKFGYTIVMEETDFLRRVQLLATTIGALPHLNLATNCLTFNAVDLTVIFGGRSTYRDRPHPALTVESVEHRGELSPTYCFTEHERGLATFNGIVTSNSETYGLLLETLIRDSAERTKLMRAIETIPNIKKKADWAFTYIESQTATFAHRMIGFACVEGIFFSSSFASIFWLKKRGLLPGVAFSNELISRDEGLHVEFAAMLYNRYIQNKLTDAEVHKIVGDAVDVEMDFVCDALPVRLIGMNADLMCQYVKFVADRLLQSLGHPKLYDAKNPFEFMDLIGQDNKSNFFELKTGAYQKAGVMGGGGETAHQFKIDEEF
jgi:ribonucleotide reductase beta subunit family protein with ferritin-like domain